MKTMKIISTILCIGILFSSCKKDDDSNNIETQGLLQFNTSNPLNSGNTTTFPLKSISTNPPLIGDTTITYTTSLKLCVGDVWVSQGIVRDGEPNNMDWIRITNSTNTELKLFEDYSFSVIKIPAGSYKSVKITFRNVFYRYAQLVSDPSVAYELLETMGSWTSLCDVNDTTWVQANYFGPGGNHHLLNGIFESVSSGEKLGGFSIEADKTAMVTWRLYAGATTPCTTYLIDENSNLEWDCGIDRMEFDCPPELEYMWDFVVEYE